MATRTRDRAIDDNEIRSQLDEVSMEDAYDLFKSVSRFKIREKEEKVRKKLPNSCTSVGNGKIAKKLPRFIGRRDKETLFLLSHLFF